MDYPNILTLFRFYKILKVIKPNILIVPEPVGSVSPKIISGEEFKVVRRRINDAVNIFCPAQAYPTPVFR